MKKKLFGLILVAGLVLGMSVAVYATSYDVYISDDCPYFMHNQEIALLMHEMLHDIFPVDRSGDSIYPISYGGSFINSYGNLVVNVVGTIDAFESVLDNAFSARALFSQNIQIVQFSYVELRDKMDFLTDLWKNNPYCKIRNSMMFHAMSITNNNITIGLYGYNETLIYAFMSYVTNSPMIVFEEAGPRALGILRHYESEETYISEVYTAVESIAPRNTAVFPGDRIVIVGIGELSAGYGVQRTGGIRGFLTSPHGLNVAGRTIRHRTPTGTIIGTFSSLIQFSFGVDAGMIDSSNFSNMVEARTVIRTGTVLEGQRFSTISTREGHTASRIQRNITVTNHNFFCEAVGLGNLVLTNGRAYGGDSGGLVYQLSATGGQYAIAFGLIVSGNWDGSGMAFSRSTLIHRDLGVGLAN